MIMIRGFFQRLMFGRYGSDQLNYFLLFSYVILYVIAWVGSVGALYYISLLPLFWGIFRLFSRNLPRRQAENEKFLGLFRPVTSWLHLRRTVHNDRDNCYFKCPGCGQQLRAPKGKGKLRITCRTCGATFEKKT